MCLPGRRAKLLVLASWILSIIFSLPILLFYDIYEHKGIRTTEHWDPSNSG